MLQSLNIEHNSFCGEFPISVLESMPFLTNIFYIGCNFSSLFISYFFSSFMVFFSSSVAEQSINRILDERLAIKIQEFNSKKPTLLIQK